MGSSPFRLLLEFGRDVAHAEPRVDGDSRVERRNRPDRRILGTEREGLVKRLETEIGSVDADHDAIEDTHVPMVSDPARDRIGADAEPGAYFGADHARRAGVRDPYPRYGSARMRARPATAMLARRGEPVG